MSTTGALLVCGSSSGAGKSTVVAGLCRLLGRDGSAVAPFKAQNMSNHSAVTSDGGEVGRAQAMQAAAAGVDVETAMNPILLKPSADRTSHVVVRGHEVGRTDAAGWGRRTAELRPVVLDAFRSLRERFDVVVAEGAGGAAEINLLDRDLVNLPFARAAGIRSLLVVDIDRGGAFAAAHGTVDLLPDALRAAIGGIVFNRFRGDPSLLDPGIADLEARNGIPVLGVLPHLGPGSLLGVEDSLDIGTGADHAATRSTEPVRVVAVRLPHLANPSDLDPLVVEPDVTVAWATRPSDLAGADLVVLPGSRSTVADLAWLRERGLDRALADTDAAVIGICAGLQMLGRHLVDHVESRAGEVSGLGLLPVTTRFEEPKVVRRRRGRVGATAVHGYQIHLGRVTAGGEPWLRLVDEHGDEDDGAIGADSRVRGTTLHGIFDDDVFRGQLLSEVAGRRGRRFQPGQVAFAERIEAQHDRLADWLATDLDVAAVVDLATEAADPAELPGW